MNGTREIAFAVIATTIALVAVFTPLAFLKGNTGRLFNEFGIAVAGSVIMSGFVALTLTPMLCAKILRVPKRARSRVPGASSAGSTAWPTGYAQFTALRSCRTGCSCWARRWRRWCLPWSCSGT